MPELLALCSATLFGAADFAGGIATRRNSVLAVTLITNGVGAVTAIVLVVLFGGTWSTQNVGWGVVGGVFGLLGLTLLYQGLATGPNRIVSPVCGVVSAIIPVAGGLLAGERPGPLAVVGLALALPAIWLVAGGDLRMDGTDRRPILMAAAAGLGFGLFLVCLAQTGDDAGAVPLLSARLGSLSILVVAAAISRPELPRGSSNLALPVLAGVLDMTANGFFLWSAQDGDLSIVGALVNLFPVTTVLLAMVVLKERLTKLQAVGLALAVTAAALLS